MHEQITGEIGVFINNKLRIIDEKCDLQEEIQEEVSMIIFNKEVKQMIASNEAISAIDASVKKGNMAGLWRIE